MYVYPQDIYVYPQDRFLQNVNHRERLKEKDSMMSRSLQTAHEVGGDERHISRDLWPIRAKIFYFIH